MQKGNESGGAQGYTQIKGFVRAHCEVLGRFRCLGLRGLEFRRYIGGVRLSSHKSEQQNPEFGLNPEPRL